MGAIRDRMLAELELLGMSGATRKSYVGCCRVIRGVLQEVARANGRAGDSRVSPPPHPRSQGRRVLRRRVRRGDSVSLSPCASQILASWRICRVRGSRESCRRCRAGTKSRTILNAVRSLKYRTILIAAYGAGLRISEARRAAGRGHRQQTNAASYPSGEAGQGSLRRSEPAIARRRCAAIGRRPSRGAAICSRAETPDGP